MRRRDEGNEAGNGRKMLLTPFLFQVIVEFGLVGLYFWLLDRYSESGFVFWMILIGGLVLSVVADLI